ncbi:Fumarate--(S)-2,3-diaminopropanoate ligase [Paenibacillus allorhizoplanae]|uniref:Fumarate--(S)-2,3-diaminopropanoate ligase n=1 Tax=Paenibacillus allorhizoplanae TaxID=2905648 RepID=A0ABN8GJE2_9BACL|nr:AMP-binding protein [Paenibacillus allorhizoplanae]CAH1206578.1 Fumarate--(S)-2,3-diaminopropanoate ligase [Paenibacillus allorhizoplanae]
MRIKEVIQKMKRQFPWLLSGHEQEEHAALPLVSAGVLESYYYTDANPFLQVEEMNRYQTSGTSSKRRKTIFYSRSDEEAYLRIKLDVFRTILEGTRYRTAMADMGTGHAEATAVEVFRELGMEVESVSFRLPIEQHIERLQSFRPEVLYTMPSILDRILQASENPAHYGIQHVILVGEIASPGWRQRTAERLGIAETQVTDTYGSIEIGTIAYFSHKHGRYLFAEGIVAEGVKAELLDGDLEPLPDELEQVLVLTSSVRDAFPALRYVTYDVVRDLKAIDVDGIPTQSFQSVVKRIGPDLKHGEKISIYDIEDVVYRHLREASVRVQVSGNGLTVYVYSALATPAVLNSIRTDVESRIPAIGMMIQAKLLDGIQVIGGTFEDSQNRTFVKNKKIFYT